MKALIGNFDTRLDSKRRLAIASGIREQISSACGENFVLVPDPDPQNGRERYLWLFPDVYFRSLAASMKRGALTAEHQLGLERWIAIAQVIRPDGQGRVVIPKDSMKGVVVTEELKLSCNGNHIEIWPRDKWDAEYGVQAVLPRNIFDMASDGLDFED